MQDIDGTSVRWLSIKFCDSLATFRAVATFFPAMMHLSIYGSIFIRPKSRWSKAFRCPTLYTFPKILRGVFFCDT
jgi:hypothetical protein